MIPLSCRPGCAACCIAPSITAPIPGMPEGKPAGVPCVQLDEQGLCRLFGKPERPTVCVGILPELSWCGTNTDEAMTLISQMEQLTATV